MDLQSKAPPGPSSKFTDLPPEIWLRVLGWATAVPGALDTEPRDPFATPPRLPPEEERKALRASLVTKRYVVLVCRAWHDLALRYLWEAICIGLGRVIESLSLALRRSKRLAEETATDACPLVSAGSYTKRLDIALREAGIHRDEDLGCLAEIIQCLPNLEIFFLRSRVYPDLALPRAIVHALASTPRCLRVLDLPADNLYVRPHHLPLSDDTSSWSLLVQRNPHLRALRCGDILPFEVTGRDDDIPRSLQSLSFAAQEWPPWVRTEHAPFRALRDLRYVHTYIWNSGTHELSDPDAALTGVLKAAGQTVQRLYFEHDQPRRFTRPVDMRHLWEHCPLLTQLILKIPLYLSHWSNDGVVFKSLPPSVTHLGFESFRGESATSGQLGDVFESLVQMEADSLQVIRFLDRRVVKWLRCHHAKVLVRARQSTRDRGWRLEDHTGDLL